MATETDVNVRKGIKLYIDYFENEFAEISDEELGILIRGLYQYDQYKELNSEYSEKINKDILLKTLFKILMKNNDRAVAEWDRKRKYYAEKDKQKKIKEIMKSEDCSYEEALDIYNFMQPEQPKAKAKDKTVPKTKSNLHNFNIFGIPFSFEYSSNTHFTNEQLENEFSNIKEFLEFDEVMFINIVNDTFAIASSDNFKKTIKEYCSEIRKEV